MTKGLSLYEINVCENYITVRQLNINANGL